MQRFHANPVPPLREFYGQRSASCAISEWQHVMCLILGLNIIFNGYFPSGGEDTVRVSGSGFWRHSMLPVVHRDRGCDWLLIHFISRSFGTEIVRYDTVPGERKQNIVAASLRSQKRFSLRQDRETVSHQLSSVYSTICNDLDFMYHLSAMRKS
jgi:hypothetical protein